MKVGSWTGNARRPWLVDPVPGRRRDDAASR
jgi:hypothetical protein